MAAPATGGRVHGGQAYVLFDGGSESPATLCAQLAAEGFGKLAAAVGENLGPRSRKFIPARWASWPPAVSRA